MHALRLWGLDVRKHGSPDLCGHLVIEDPAVVLLSRSTQKLLVESENLKLCDAGPNFALSSRPAGAGYCGFCPIWLDAGEAELD